MPVIHAHRATAARRFNVDSEVGSLRQVLLHRGHQAKPEHDAFAMALVQHGVDVLYLGDLLADTVEDDVARSWLIDHVVGDDDHGPFLRPELVEHLHSLAPADLARALTGGVVTGDLLFRAGGLRFATSSPEDPLLPALPTQPYVRDTSCWMYDGVSINPMADAARRRETIHLAAVYRFHPRFEDGAFHVWYDDGNFSQPRAKVQGGDVLVIGRGVVVLGIGQFTSAQAIEWLATAMFAAGSAREVLAVELPQARLRTRLDSLLTMVDRGVFAAGVGVEQLRCWSLRPGEDAGELRVERTGALLPGLARALGTHDLRFIATGNHGNDVLTIAPGVVMSFEHNAATNADLRRAGIEVVTIAGAELGARHGGPRRISCPLERDPVF